MRSCGEPSGRVGDSTVPGRGVSSAPIAEPMKNGTEIMVMGEMVPGRPRAVPRPAACRR